MDAQLLLFTTPAPPPTQTTGETRRPPADPPAVGAPVEQLRLLDAELGAGRAALSLEAWPEAPPSPPSPPCQAPILCQGRESLARHALVDEQLAALLPVACLDAEERAVVRHLEKRALVDDRTWLELLVDACRAEATDPADPADVAAVLKHALRRGRALGPGMLARSRFFWTIRQLTTASYPDIAEAWGLRRNRDHTTVMYGVENHEIRLRRGAPPAPTRSAERWIDPVEDSVDTGDPSSAARAG